MDDVVIRSRYQRHRVPVKKRKKSYRNSQRFVEKLFIQIAAASIILLIAIALKNTGTPVTENITDRIRVLLSQNINITTIYEQIDSFISRIKPGILAESDTDNDLGSIMPIADDLVLPDSDPIKKNEMNSNVVDAQLVDNEINPGFEKKEVMSSEFVNLELPLEPPVEGIVVLKYGWVDDSISALNRFHYGIDLEMEKENSIKSVMDGSVTETGSNPEYANYIIVEHSLGYKTIYAHCDIILVEPGQFVAEGENIGTISAKGLNNVSHLHFEMWKDGNAMDPMEYIKVQ